VYYQPQYDALPAPSARGMSTNARGPRGMLEASSMLDLGALSASTGMTRAQITGFLDDMQEVALATVLAAAPRILERNKRITQAQINQLGVRIGQLRRIQLAQPQTGLRGLLGMPPNMMAQADAPVYVSLVEVQLLVGEAIAALNATD
jgi:hypothetical protein